jgi:O-succinylbenzoate synthase
VNTLIDFDGAVVVALPVQAGFGEPGPRESMLLEGPQGWGEFSPPRGVADQDLHRWLTAAIEPGTVGWPDAVRGRVPVAVTVPAVDPERAHHLVATSACRTADVAVGDCDDTARIEAVRDALGPGGRIRCVAAGDWDIDTAVRRIGVLLRVAGELDYVQQPCATSEETAEVRRRASVRVAVDVSGVSAHAWATLGAHADVAVLNAPALGGVRRALRAAEISELPCTVQSGRETSIGLAGAVALAGALPELPFACAVGRPRWVTADVTTEARALVPVNGFLPVAPMPAAPEPELMHRHAVGDARSVEKWHRRLQQARTAAT